MKTFVVVAVTLATSLAACASGPAKDPACAGEYFYNFENSYLTEKMRLGALTPVPWPKPCFPPKTPMAGGARPTL